MSEVVNFLSVRDEEKVDQVAKAICNAAKIWKSSAIWPAAEAKQQPALRIVSRYRDEARAAILQLRVMAATQGETDGRE